MVAALPLLYTFDPSPAFRDLEDDDSPLIAVRAANGTGKTDHAMRKVALSALAKPGTHYRIVGVSFKMMLDSSAAYLWRFLKPYVAKGSEYRPGTGWSRHNLIVLRNGSTIQLRAYSDDADTQEGAHRLEMIVLDEVPPQAHYWANKGRAKQLIILFTVQTKATPGWLRKEIEGNDETPVVSPSEPWVRVQHHTGWVQYVVAMTRDTVPFYNDLEYQEKVGKYRGTEYEATRIWAGWETVRDDRVFSGWSSSCVRTQEEIVRLLRDPRTGRAGFDVVRYGIDYGLGEKHVQVLVLERADVFYVVNEFVGGARSDNVAWARAFKAAVDYWVAPDFAGLQRFMRDTAQIYGDINSAGPGHDGDSMNGLFNAGLRAVYGLAELPINGARAPATKAEGAKDARELGMNLAMMQGRWIVSDRCPVVRRAFENYTGGPTEPWKDPIDALGYAVYDRVLLLRRPASATQIRR